MDSKVFRYSDSSDEDKLQSLLDKGWHVKFVTAQHVASGGTYGLHGDILYILERD